MHPLAFLRPNQRASTARVHTNGCRGYLVELDPGPAAPGRMLTDFRGEVVHFRTLEHVRGALRRRGVGDAVLVQRHACEEATAFGASTARERGTVVLRGRARP